MVQAGEVAQLRAHGQPGTPGAGLAGPDGPQRSPLPLGLIHLPSGLPGFPDQRHFRLESIAGAHNGLLMLRAEESAEPAFVVLALDDWRSAYAADDITQVAKLMEIALDDLGVFLIVTLIPRAEGLEAYVNLRAPLLLDRKSHQAAQVVLPNPTYPLRERLQKVPAV